MRHFVNETTSGIQTVTINDLFLSGWPHFHPHEHDYWIADVIIAVLGAVGNVLQYVMMTERSLKFLSYSVYLRFMSISDTFLLTVILVEETEKALSLAVLANVNDWLCKILNAFSFAVKLLSPWLMVGLTVDRYLCVCFPLSRDRLCTRTKAAVVCSGLSAVSFVSTVPILAELRLDHGECHAPVDFQYYFIFMRLLVSSILPCLAILVLNVLIIVSIKRGHQFRDTFLSARRKHSTNRSRRDSSTRPLVLVSILAFLTLLPISVAECTDGVLRLIGRNTAALRLGETLWPLWNVVYLLNFAQNFYILIGSASSYRNIMMKRCSCFVRTWSRTAQTRTLSPTGQHGMSRVNTDSTAMSVIS